MSLFKKPDDHVGSGLDKPKPKGIIEKVVDTVKAAGQPAPRQDDAAAGKPDVPPESQLAP